MPSLTQWVQSYSSSSEFPVTGSTGDMFRTGDDCLSTWNEGAYYRDERCVSSALNTGLDALDVPDQSQEWEPCGAQFSRDLIASGILGA